MRALVRAAQADETSVFLHQGSGDEQGTDSQGMDAQPQGRPLAAPWTEQLETAPITPTELPGRETQDAETHLLLSAEHLPLMT